MNQHDDTSTHFSVPVDIRTTLMRVNGHKNIPINKGHFDLDTADRIDEFHARLGRDWDQYGEYRNSWIHNASKQIVRDYPILVDVELASSCNLKCPMCYTTTDHFKETVKRKIMKWELYQKIIDEVAEHIFALRLSWRGESTLHPKFVDAVRYAKTRGIREVSFLTNGYKLDLDYFKELHEAGADWITVSFDGVGDEYNRIRAPLVYEEMLEILRLIHEYKQANNIEKPVIKIQGIWPSIRSDPEKFYTTLSEVSDLVAFNPLIDYLGNDKPEDILYEENFSCPQIYQRLFVSSTGEAMMCNSDEYGEEIVGNVHEQSIHEIWHGEKLQRIRDLHAEYDGFKKVPVCTKCFYPRLTQVTETAVVMGRRIDVENYVNRPQIIGK